MKERGGSLGGESLPGKKTNSNSNSNTAIEEDQDDPKTPFC